MKKYIVMLTALVMVCSYGLATDIYYGSTPVKNDTGIKPPVIKDYVVMSEGTMMVVKNGLKMMMDTNITMTNGTVMMIDGSYTLKDGSRMLMKEGDKMDMDGNLMKAPTTTPSY
jgi:hypothetical protein